jgi:hypothetical protein
LSGKGSVARSAERPAGAKRITEGRPCCLSHGKVVYDHLRG